jgi:hypothetical protein
MGARSIPNELDLLKETVTTLIANVESLKKKTGEEEQEDQKKS